jgi:hypothetical protein
MTEEKTIIEKRDAAGFENAEGVFCDNFLVRLVILIEAPVGAAEH